ncbi:uncharacterized protein [Spinacia oleracea]|uniref:Retrotransposon Copia-like N-terminal domain-containing protein n=1 Tax=Spinacia oleracea TaxID=3562 RepID=A0A9R0JKK2_SPIOL|nr:uncharacterized protein LOC110777780 [Spinacia oleracea]
MSNLAKLKIVALDITGKNYLSWVLDAEIHLDAKGFGDTIKEGNKATCQDKAKAMIFLRHHLHKGLQTGYVTVKDPQILWSNLKEMYDHQKTVILPKARYNWLHLILQDFKSVSEYNSTMFQITSQLKLCGEKITDADMLEKTYSTFHANNVVLQTQYREKVRPTGSTPFPESNVTTHNGKKSKNKDHATSSGRGQWCGHRRGRRFDGYGRGHGRYYNSSHSQQKWDRKDGKCEKGKSDNVTKERKNVETNLVFEDGESDFDSGYTTHLEVADFFTYPKGNN